MQRIAYTVERIEPSHYPLPTCKNAQTPNWVQPVGVISIVLRFPCLYEIKRIMFKAGGAGFVEISAGITIDDLATPDNWRCLVPCTQLVRDAKTANKLLSEREPTTKPKIWNQFGRYVAPPGQGFAFVVVRLEALPDGPQTVGFQWIELFGSALGEREKPSTAAAHSHSPSLLTHVQLNSKWVNQAA